MFRLESLLQRGNFNLEQIQNMLQANPALLDGQAGAKALNELICYPYGSMEQKLALTTLFLDTNPNLLNLVCEEQTPLMLACDTANLSIVNLLMARDADVNMNVQAADGSFPKNALYYALVSARRNIFSDNSSEIIATILKAGADIRQVFGRKNILHVLAHFHFNTPWLYDNLLTHIATQHPDLLEAKDENGNTPLAAALIHPAGFTPILALKLLELGANPHVSVYTPQGERTVLFMFSGNGAAYINEIEALIEKGVSIKKTLAVCKTLPVDSVNRRHAEEEIAAVKRAIQQDPNKLANRKLGQSLRDSHIILDAINANHYGDFVKWHRGKPSQAVAHAACTKLIAKLNNVPGTLFNDQDKHALSAFNKLNKAYKRIR